MADADRLLGMYLHLARASHMRQQPMVRAKLLVLAGVQAEEMGLAQISALCRHKILMHNRRHLVRRWPTLETALTDEHFQTYLKQLKRRYSREKIEHMMHALGIEMGQEREAYFNDLEYAAALLDTRPDEIADVLAESGSLRSSGPQAEQLAKAVVPHGAATTARRVRDVWLVWAPFVAGLLVLCALAVASRVLGR